MEKNINTQDDRLKAILSGTKIEASDNLKHRIMQQIQTEAALSKKAVKGKKFEPVLESMLPLFGLIYALIFIFAGAMYLTAGKEGITSTFFYCIVSMLIVIGSAFWIISFLDNKRKSKSKEH